MDEIKLINDIIESNGHELQILLDNFKTTNDNQITFVLNMFTSLLNDNFENKRSSIIDQLFIYIKNTTDNNNLINDFIKNWNLSLSKNSDEDNYITLSNLLESISIKTTTNKIFGNTNNTNIILVKEIWKMSSFKKIIKLFPHLTFGIDYCHSGIFCILGKLTTYNDLASTIEIIEILTNDKSIHDDLLTYISHILDVNISYTYQNNTYIYEKKCSTTIFLKFIFKILIAIMKTYSLEEINTNILNDKIFTIKEYDLTNLPFYQKLMVVILKAIPICHTYIIKKYIDLYDKLVSPYRFLIYGNNYNEDTLIQNINLIKTNLSDDDKNDVQLLYINYEKICEKLQIDEIFGDFLIYVDYATISLKHDFYGNVKNAIFKFVSNIMGGETKMITNQHIRSDASKLITRLLPIKGFELFGDIFNNIFNFISEVNFFKWTQELKAITYQKELLETMLILVNENSQIKNCSRKKISSTLFNILDRGIDIINLLYKVCDEYRDNIYTQQINDMCYNMVQIIYNTICIYKRIYETKIVNEIYTEVDEKFYIFVENIFSPIKNNPISLVLRERITFNQIIKMIYEIIYTNMKYKNYSIELIKELLVNNISISQLELCQKNELIEYLTKIIVDKNDYPQDFLDPLTCSLITDPIKIPNVNEIFDRKSILTHIHSNQSNPYTRELLTFEILDNYNSKTEIIDEITEFKKKLEEFKNQNAETAK